MHRGFEGAVSQMVAAQQEETCQKMLELYYKVFTLPVIKDLSWVLEEKSESL